MIGYDSAFIGTTIALPAFKSEFGLTIKQKTQVQFNFISSNIVRPSAQRQYHAHSG